MIFKWLRNRNKTRRELLIEELEEIYEEYEWELLKYVVNINDLDLTASISLFLIIEYIKSNRRMSERNE